MVFFMISSQFFFAVACTSRAKRNWMKGMNFSWYIYFVVCIYIFMHVWLMYCRWFFGAQIKRVAGFILSLSMIFLLMMQFCYCEIFSYLNFIMFFLCVNDIIIHGCRDKLKDLTFHEPQQQKDMCRQILFSLININFIFHDETKISNWNLIQYFHISLM